MWHADPGQPQSRMARARRPLILAAVVGGAILQYVMVGSQPPAQSRTRGLGVQAQPSVAATRSPAPHAP